MIRAIAIAAALGTAFAILPPARADTASEAAKSYRIDTIGTTDKVTVGEKGKLVLSIVPVEKVHVDSRAPLRIALESTPGVNLSKTSLGKDDVLDPKEEGRRFEIPFVVEKAGKHEARAKLEFFVCSDRWCAKQVRTVSIPLEAK